MPQHQGFGHVTLTVTDLNKSAEFYNRVFGTQTVASAEDEHGPFVICAGPGLMIGLRTHEKTPKKDSFRFARVGLDHLGVHVESKAELEKWRVHLDEHKVTNSGIVESAYGLHLNAKDPDKIPIEFFVAGPQG